MTIYVRLIVELVFLLMTHLVDFKRRQGTTTSDGLHAFSMLYSEGSARICPDYGNAVWGISHFMVVLCVVLSTGTMQSVEVTFSEEIWESGHLIQKR